MFPGLAASRPGTAQARKINLGDLQKIVGVSRSQISPDGKSIVIVVSRVNWDEDRYDSLLVTRGYCHRCAAAAHQHPQRQHPQKILSVSLVPDDQSAEVLKPGKQSLNIPPAAIASQSPQILPSVFSLRCGEISSIPYLLSSESSLSES